MREEFKPKKEELLRKAWKNEWADMDKAIGEDGELIPSWETLPLDYRLKFTTDGKYSHIKASPLLKALYGFDPISGEVYTWDDFHNEEEGRVSLDAKQAAKL